MAFHKKVLRISRKTLQPINSCGRILQYQKPWYKKRLKCVLSDPDDSIIVQSRTPLLRLKRTSDDLTRDLHLFEAPLGSRSKSFCGLSSTFAARNVFVYAVKTFRLTANSEEAFCPDCFCVICEEYMFKKFRLNVSDFVKKAYLDYFGFPLPTNAKPWIPSLLSINAWDEFVCAKFLGNRKSDGYIQHVEKLLMHFQQLGCNMVLSFTTFTAI
ncbi:hypothetical protein EVAR_68266_1 [Eumeta japonica]|uniref:Uncharacterized protein n=1 Tax=Eumeta variegata TaxID=151549 RepID=A0A4C1SH68_EUMVA|nr:hypothetical protein EVAR_68266_1 [Eumeta japonica]